MYILQCKQQLKVASLQIINDKGTHKVIICHCLKYGIKVLLSCGSSHNTITFWQSPPSPLGQGKRRGVKRVECSRCHNIVKNLTTGWHSLAQSQILLLINKMHNNLETNQCSYSWTGLSLGSSVLMMIFMSVLESQPSLSTLDVFPVFNFYCQYILG